MRKTLAVSLVSTEILVAGSALAQTDASKLYASKCASCHAPDGTGSAMGKKMGVHDFHSPEVQGQSDAQLTDVISKGKNKMPSYEKKLKADEISALVAYIRTLAKN